VTKLADLKAELQEILVENCRRDHIPGATLAVAHGDEIIELAAGVLNLNTGVEATSDSLFQIGSITKTFTATMVMQLVDEGLVELDAPVRGYVPEFAVADQTATETVTVRQLLCHTSGFDGDVFDDYGRGDDAIARYVAGLKDRGQIVPPGEKFSYCNSGYCVLGRLIELVRGLPSWDAALREQLIKPLGLTHAVSLAEEALLFRTAVGHLAGEGGNAAEPRVTPNWQLPRSTAPAGATLCASARDLVAYARFHSDGGLAADGSRLLSAASAEAMRQPQVHLPALDERPPDSWGLGWEIAEFEGGRVYGHSGDTIGQAATLEFVPEHGLAYAALTNGGMPGRLFDTLRTRILGELAGIGVPAPPRPPRPAIEIDPRRFVGRYKTARAYYDVTQNPDGRLQLETGLLGPLRELVDEEPTTYPLTGFSPTTLIEPDSDEGGYRTFAFPEVGEDGRAPYMFAGGRVAPRVEDGEQG
jgi:CubicO group peptidase (beta-lactamase class C family)